MSGFRNARRHANTPTRPLRIETLESRRMLAITVDTLLDEADGSISDGDVSLRDAIALAPSGETIEFHSSLAGQTIAIELGELRIDKPLTINAEGLANGLTIDAQGNSRVIRVDDLSATDREVTLNNLTITGGATDHLGSGILNRENLTLVNSNVIFNDDDAITIFDGTVELRDSTVSHNLGIGIVNYSILNIERSTIASNSGIGVSGAGEISLSEVAVTNNGRGGVAHTAEEGSERVTLTDSQISGNTGFGGVSAGNLTMHRTSVTDNTNTNSFSASGGGLRLFSRFSNAPYDYALDSAIISDSLIANNHAPGPGGGIWAGFINISISNTTISQNTSDAYGGGAFFNTRPWILGTPFPSHSVRHSTITGNSAAQRGSGVSIVSYDNNLANTTVAFRSTIIASNETNPDGSPDVDRTGDMFLSASLIGINTHPNPDDQGDNQLGTSESPIDPLLGPLANNGGPTRTHALLPGSPAIDQGSAVGSGFDQRGAPFLRIVGPRSDVGALEQQGPIITRSADFDQDSKVDGTDFLVWQRNFGTLNGAGISNGDADLDGDVDRDDLAEWQFQYAFTYKPGFNASTSSLGAGQLNHDVDLAYLNDDDILDAFVTTDGGPIQVWIGNGDGTFTITNQAFGVGNNIYAALGDIDNDGDVDAAVAVANTEISLWLNDGDGFFSSGGTLVASSPLDLALGHLDGDDRLDLFVAQVSDPDLVFLNDPTQGFIDSGQLLGNASSKSVELADLNGDGFLDAFVAQVNGAAGAPNSVWFNDGNGIFTDSGQQLGNGTSQHVTLGDIDGDFDIDAVVANEGANRIYLNDGSGVFTASGQTLGAAGSSHVQLADFDSDGDLDIYVANWFDQPDRVWINNGLGQFLGSQSLGSNTSSHVALADIDGDGDIDAVVATYSSAQSNTIWLNDQIGGLAAVDQALSEFADE